jgi:hypothetical protein
MKTLTFGNTFYVAPNTIDFSTVFLKFDLKSQAAVLGTLIGILVIYLLLLKVHRELYQGIVKIANA